MNFILRTVLLSIALSFFCTFPVNAQIYKWAQSISRSSNITSSSTCVDLSGYNYITGYFTDTAAFGTFHLTSFGLNDIFIAKYDSNGNCVWAVQAGGTSDDYGNSISIDANGNIYVTGAFLGTSNFGTFQLTSYGNNGYADIFIAKYDPNGNCLWAKQGGGNNLDYGFGIAADKTGNCFVTGYFRETAIFGSFQLISNGLDDIFLAKYDPNGNCLWVKQSGSKNDDIGYGVAVDDSGNGFLTGYFNETVFFGSIQLTSFGKEDIFIAKYDPNGNCIWAEQAGDTASDIGYGIAVDSNGNSFITGEFQRTALFGTHSIVSQGDYDIFTAKYDPNGNCLWCNSIGSRFEDRGKSITVDEIGDCYIAGQYNNNGSNDIIMAEYDPYGRSRWIQTAGGIGEDGGLGITAQPNGNIYVTGTFSGSASIGTFQLTGGGSFLTKIYCHNLNITAPLGGEHWDTGSLRTITWNSNDDGYIKIEARQDWWAPWFVVADSINASSGGYTFIVYGGYYSSSIRLTSLSYNNSSECPSGFNSTPINFIDLTITSPTIPLIWASGSLQNITWKDSGNIANVRLEYTTNNGIKWRLITNSTSGLARSYTWQIPNLYSKSCRIRITDISNPYLYDVSNELFTISPASQKNIVMVSPLGGERWDPGSIQQIKWASNGITNLNIYYTYDGGFNWNIISQNVSATVNSFAWNIPVNPSPYSKVKIEDASDPSIYGVSNNYFIIAPPRSYYPSYNLTFANESRPANNVYEFDIYMLSTDTASIELASISLGFTFNTKILNGGSGEASWVPGTSELTNTYQIPINSSYFNYGRVIFTGLSAPGPGKGSMISNIYPGIRIGRMRLINDRPFSGNNFDIHWVLGMTSFSATVVSGYVSRVNTDITSSGSFNYYFSKQLSITCPVGTENWQTGVPYTITWNSTDSGYIKIESLTGFDSTWTLIKDSVKASIGSFTYSFPNASSQCKIKLTNLSTNYTSISPDWFYFHSYSEHLTLTAPNTSVYWPGGTVQNIKWYRTPSTFTSYYRLDYTTDNGISWHLITKKGSTTDGSYPWLVPNLHSNLCRVRVTMVSRTNEYEISDAVFTIGKDTIVILNTKVEANPAYKEYSLNQNYPNPFNPNTIIKYVLAKSSHVELRIYNSLGEKVSDLISKDMEAGAYSIEWNASGFASGVYIYQLKAGDFVSNKKMLLLK